MSNFSQNKQIEQNTYYNVGKSLATDPDRYNSMLSELQDAFEERRIMQIELQSVLDESTAIFEKNTRAITGAITETESAIDKLKENFSKETDNLLLVHPTNWSTKNQDKKTPQYAISYKLPAAVALCLIGILSLGTAVLIPDQAILALLPNETGEDTALILLLKGLIYCCLAGVLYIVVSKVIASKRFNRTSPGALFYYYMFILVAFLGWLVSASIGAFTVSNNFLLFIGLNGPILLLMGLSTWSYHTGVARKYRHLHKTIKTHQKELVDTKKKLLRLRETDFMNLYNEALKLQENREALRIGYQLAKAAYDKKQKTEEKIKALTDKLNLKGNTRQ